MTTKHAYLAALRAHIDSAHALLTAWDALGNGGDAEGYPENLPSFDEHVAALVAWGEAEAEAVDPDRAPRVDPPQVGERVVFVKEVCRYPHALITVGTTGVVVESDGCLYAVRLDVGVPDLVEWDNEVHWYTDDDTLDNVASALRGIDADVCPDCGAEACCRRFCG